MINIYGLSSSDNPDKIIYIGKTEGTLKNRLSSHKSAARSNRKNGKNVTKIQWWILKQIKINRRIIITLIDEVPDSEWKFFERHYIKLYKSLGADLKNILEGGEDNPVLRGKDNPGFNKRGSRSPSFNKRRNQSSSKQIPSTKKFKKRIAMLDVETKEIIKIFDGVTQAAKFVGCKNNTGIINVCRNKPGCHTYYGYCWKYLPRENTILKLDNFNNVIGSYPTYQAAAESINSNDIKGIWRAVKHNRNFKNYFWKNT